MEDLHLLYLQSNLVWEDPVKNRDHFDEIILREDGGFDLVVLPETFTTGFPVDPAPFAESVDGESLAWMRHLASETGAVIAGSLLLKEMNDYSNSFVWMRPDGSFERYDKRHVFSMGGEHEKIKPGSDALIVELKGWKIKPMVCYDLRFPVWSKNKYHKGNFEYDLAIYVANWPAVRAHPWNSLLVARAIENQCIVLGVNRIGKDGLGNEYAGHSKVVDPKGQIISQAQEGKEKAVHVRLSYSQLQDFRNKFNVGRDWDTFEIL